MSPFHVPESFNVALTLVIYAIGVETILELARPEGASSGISRPTGKLVLVVIVWAEAERPQPRATANRERLRELLFIIVLIIFEPSFIPRCILPAFIGSSVTRGLRTANRAKAGLCYRRDQESKPVDSLVSKSRSKYGPRHADLSYRDIRWSFA